VTYTKQNNHESDEISFCASFVALERALIDWKIRKTLHLSYRFHIGGFGRCSLEKSVNNCLLPIVLHCDSAMHWQTLLMLFSFVYQQVSKSWFLVSRKEEKRYFYAKITQHSNESF